MAASKCSAYLRPYVDKLQICKKRMSNIRRELDTYCLTKKNIPLQLQNELTECLSEIDSIKIKMHEQGKHYRKAQDELKRRYRKGGGQRSRNPASTEESVYLFQSGQLESGQSSLQSFYLSSSSGSSPNKSTNSPSSESGGSDSSQKQQKRKTKSKTKQSHLHSVQTRLDGKLKRTRLQVNKLGTAI